MFFGDIIMKIKNYLKDELKLGNIYYVAEYIDGSIEFYIDGVRSKGLLKYIEIEKDRLWEDWDCAPYADKIYDAVHIQDNVYKVMSWIKKFVDNAIRKYSPQYIHYSVNQTTKAGVYLRYAYRLASKYGYQVVIDKNNIRLYKI